MRYLVATASVHTTAAACDYLDPRLGPDDAVVALTVREPGGDPRDGEDALNVVAVRLPGVTVETATEEGEPAATVLDVAAREGVDVIVIGAHGGGPGSDDALGSTARAILEGADRPVVVVPIDGSG